MNFPDQSWIYGTDAVQPARFSHDPEPGGEAIITVRSWRLRLSATHQNPPLDAPAAQTRREARRRNPRETPAIRSKWPPPRESPTPTPAAGGSASSSPTASRCGRARTRCAPACRASSSPATAAASSRPPARQSPCWTP